MNKCIDCGKEFNPSQVGASMTRGPVCNKKHLESWSIPEEVERVVKVLKDSQHPVFLVGGSVRDYLLGRPIKDYDLVTSAKTQELEQLFPNSLEVGKQFGVVKVPVQGDVVEIATFREDGTYSDGRRPDFIQEGTLETDVQRRDFTVNGLLFDLSKKEVIDQVNGVNDLNNKIIRCIGNASDRFQEDHLRVLRALRFATVLNFQIEDSTLQATIDFAPELNKVSKERIKVEMDKIFDSPNLSQKADLLEKTKILDHVYPHLQEKSSVVLNQIKTIQNPTKELVYSWIFNQNDKLMNEYKFTNDEIKKVKNLVKVQKNILDFENLSLAEKNKTVLDPDFSQVNSFLTSKKENPLVKKIISDLNQNPLPLDLLTSGKELIEYGFSPGEKMGQLIKKLNDAVYGRQITSKEEKNTFILENKG